MSVDLPAAGAPEGDIATPIAGRPRDERATRAIAAAAVRQLTELGYARMSMETVAAEAGVARATVYRRYRDKADLVTAAVAGEGFVLAAAGDAPLMDVVAFLEQFDERFAEPCLEVIGCLLGAREEPEAMALHRARVVGPRTRALAALLQRAKDVGHLRHDADVGVLLQMLVGAVLARRVVGLASERGWARRAVEAACAGVATPSGLAQVRGADASGSSGVRFRTRG